MLHCVYLFVSYFSYEFCTILIMYLLIIAIWIEENPSTMHIACKLAKST